MPKKEGKLIKLGGLRKNWKERWFTLDSGADDNFYLNYYEKKGGKSKGQVALWGGQAISVDEATAAVKKDCAFGIAAYPEKLAATGRKYYFVAESTYEAEQWLEALNEAITKSKLPEWATEAAAKKKSVSRTKSKKGSKDSSGEEKDASTGGDVPPSDGLPALPLHDLPLPPDPVLPDEESQAKEDKPEPEKEDTAASASGSDSVPNETNKTSPLPDPPKDSESSVTADALERSVVNTNPEDSSPQVVSEGNSKDSSPQTGSDIPETPAAEAATTKDSSASTADTEVSSAVGKYGAAYAGEGKLALKRMCKDRGIDVSSAGRDANLLLQLLCEDDEKAGKPLPTSSEDSATASETPPSVAPEADIKIDTEPEAAKDTDNHDQDGAEKAEPESKSEPEQEPKPEPSIEPKEVETTDNKPKEPAKKAPPPAPAKKKAPPPAPAKKKAPPPVVAKK